MAVRHMDMLDHHHHTASTQGLKKEYRYGLWASRHLARHDGLASRAHRWSHQRLEKKWS